MNQIARFQVAKAQPYRFVAEHDDQPFEYEDGFIVQQKTGGTRNHGRIAGRFVCCVSRQVSPDADEVLQDRGDDGKFPTEPTSYGAGHTIAIGPLGIEGGIDKIYRELELKGGQP